MLLNILTWVIIGTIAGGLVLLFFPTSKDFLFGTITAGIVGAFVGGIIYSVYRIGAVAIELDLIASAIAVVGALGLIYLVYQLVKTEEKPTSHIRR